MKFSKSKLALLGLAAMLAVAGAARAEDAGSSQDQTEAIEDLRSSLGTLSAQMNDAKKKSDTSVYLNVNTDIRYDLQEYNSYTAQGSTEYAKNGANYVALTRSATTLHTPNGVDGAYIKRAELMASANVPGYGLWHLQVELAGLKLEDTGVEFNDLNLVPMMDTGSWKWSSKVGLFRQPFGIDAQTGSSALAFPERSMMNGGANPFGAAKFVTERVMGVHAMQAHDFGMMGYKVQVAVANDNGDQNPGTASLGGTAFLNTTSTAFNLKDYPYAGQRLDQDPAEFARLGIDFNFVPKFAKLNLGASAIHNSNNQAFFATGPNGALFGAQDTYGADGTLDIAPLNWKLWGEFAKFDNTVGGNTSVAKNGPAAKGWNFTSISSTESWYVISSMQPLKFFMKDAPGLDLNVRYDNYTPNVDAAGGTSSTGARLTPAYAASSFQAISYGLKYSFVGKNYTSVNYTIYGINGDFSAIGNTDLFTVQQQFYY